ncbi:MAG: FG-GAP-like repeat-containing protein, partial [Verrucomicrobia bacterium]|nr:FG-GAP-like repeat-containing protein [Verrucomicrobiota bacterium]
MRRWLWALFACQFPFFFIQAEPLLQRISSLESGLDFTNRIATSRHLTNQVLLNGSGVAAGDIDGDQATDLVFGNLQGPPQLFRNLGHWNFTNITASAGLAEAVTDSTGVLLADVDGDGDLDLVFNTVAKGTYLYSMALFPHRPFRFGIQASNANTRAEWVELAHKTQDNGFDVLTMPDHFENQLAPVPALMTIADATST